MSERFHPSGLLPRIRRKAAQVAGGTLGYIVNNVPGAVTGYIGAGRLHDYAYREDSSPKKKIRTMPPVIPFYKSTNVAHSRNHGLYSGNFNRIKKYRAGPKAIALDKGFHITNEIHGSFSDPIASYFIHSTWNLDYVPQVLSTAVVRKLLKKAGVVVETADTPLALDDLFLSGGYRIVTITRDRSNGAQSQFIYQFAGGDTIASIGVNSNLKTYFSEFLTDQRDDELYICILQVVDLTANVSDNFWRTASSFHAQQESVCVYLSSTVVIQNRTKGDGATTDASIDRVDNQPLKTTIINFKHATPMIKDLPGAGSAKGNFTKLANDGQIIVAAASLDSKYQNCPEPKFWHNYSGQSKSILQPGAMKKTGVSHHFKGKIMTVLKQMQAKSYDTATSRFSEGFGRSQLLHFEEVLRTAGSNPIVLGYERISQCGAWFTTTKPSPLQGALFVKELTPA